MSDIDAPKLPRGNFLAGKLGPLPVWAWGAILGGGVLAFYLLRNRGGQSSDSDTTDGSALDTIGYQTSGSAQASDDSTDTGTNQSGNAQDNQSWLTTAISGTANALSASPAVVSSVLTRYLYDGGSFTDQERKYIDQAIKLYGAPPQGTGGNSTFTPASSGSSSTGGATGAHVANPYTFTIKGNAWYLVNSNTGKSAPIKSSEDKTALQKYVGNLGKGSKTPVPASVLTYIGRVS